MSSIFNGMAAIFVDTFGEGDLVPYTHGATTVSVRAIFDDPTMLMDDGPGPAKVIAVPKLHCDVDDLPSGFGQGDSVTVRGTVYVVRAPLPDGRGMVVMELERAP